MKIIREQKEGQTVTNLLPLENSHSPEFALEYGWI